MQYYNRYETKKFDLCKFIWYNIESSQFYS